MITYIIMSILLLSLILITIYGAKIEKRKDFFTFEDTKVLKGIICIIVILVHIPKSFQNPIQDMIGSFAYIGVTFFFLTSSYGLKYKMDNKQDYLNNFWQNRLSKLLVPAIIINIVASIIEFLSYGFKESIILNIFNINKWVLLLLLFYLLFYLINKMKISNLKKDILIIMLVVICSLVDKLTPFKITLRWPTECLGFAYGIILYDYFNSYKSWINKNYLFKLISLFIIGVIFGLLYLKFKPLYFIGDYCLKIILAIVLLMLLMQLIARIKLGNKISKFLGSISYEIYLFHYVSFKILQLIKINFNSGIYIVIVIIITIIFSFIINKISKLIVNKLIKS